MKKRGMKIQLLVLVPNPKGEYHISGGRSFEPPAKYNATSLLEEILKAAGVAVEAIDKNHLS